MKKGIGFALCAMAMSVAWAQADEQPVYDAGTETLTIPSASEQDQPGYFQDVRMEAAGDGLWRVAELHEGVLLEERYVEHVWTTSTSGVPHQFFVHVAGTFNSGCPQVGRVEQQRDGNEIKVFIYYKNSAWLRNPELISCTAAMEPFEVTVPLDIYGLEAGEYSVSVNNHPVRTFVLENNNVTSRLFGGERRPHCMHEPRPQQGWAAYSCNDGTNVTLQ